MFIIISGFNLFFLILSKSKSILFFSKLKLIEIFSKLFTLFAFFVTKFKNFLDLDTKINLTPFSANLYAMDSPIPLPAPVISATLFSSFIFISQTYYHV